MKDNTLKISKTTLDISLDTSQYPPISLPTSYVKHFLKGISIGQAKFLEAKFLEYARILHNILANSRTKVAKRRRVVNGEKNRGASGIKSATQPAKKKDKKNKTKEDTWR
tara:strand:- start:21 stop:350 length:330 start_codon:yes stop_codon:yes gene_type:complete